LRKLIGPFLCILCASAQTPQDLPVIRVGTRLVEVTVVAHDKKGPAAGLTREDFTVFDNGVPQKIAFFSVNSVRPPFRPPTPSGAGVFTNRTEQRSDAPGRVTVIVMDGLNTDFGAQAFAREQALKVVREVQPRDRIAIYALATRLRVLQDFTNDANLLTQALEKYTGSVSMAPQWIPPSHATGGDSEGAAMAKSTEVKVSAMNATYASWLTADEVTELANELARIPGRKSLVWLSSAFPIGLYKQASAEYLPLHDRSSGTAWALAKANVAAYPVDARGAVGLKGGNPQMDELAALTGGRAFYGANDVAAEIREALQDSEITYTLGFYPEASDGKYHSLSVETARQGVDVRCRKGYFASDPLLPVDGGVPAAAEIASAIWSPLDSTGIAIQARLVGGGDAETIRLAISAPASDLSLQPMADGRLGVLDLVVAQRANDGSVATAYSEEVQVRPGRGRADDYLPEGLFLRREIKLAKGATRLRIVMYDRNTGRLGSLEFPLH
jgi:VWFA-related protein